MTLRERIREQWIRTIMMGLLAASGIYSCSLKVKTFSPIKFVGLERSVANRAFKKKWNEKDVNGMRTSHEGESLGLVFGSAF